MKRFYFMQHKDTFQLRVPGAFATKILQTTKPVRLHYAKSDRICQLKSVLLPFIHHPLRSLRLCESK